ncbi:hypothetical protein V8C86DRAFT_815612 [Haematococcus lacustris]
MPVHPSPPLPCRLGWHWQAQLRMADGQELLPTTPHVVCAGSENSGSGKVTAHLAAHCQALEAQLGELTAKLQEAESLVEARDKEVADLRLRLRAAIKKGKRMEAMALEATQGAQGTVATTLQPAGAGAASSLPTPCSPGAPADQATATPQGTAAPAPEPAPEPEPEPAKGISGCSAMGLADDSSSSRTSTAAQTFAAATSNSSAQTQRCSSSSMQVQTQPVSQGSAQVQTPVAEMCSTAVQTTADVRAEIARIKARGKALEAQLGAATAEAATAQARVEELEVGGGVHCGGRPDGDLNV